MQNRTDAVNNPGETDSPDEPVANPQLGADNYLLNTTDIGY
jgi:hypothetical protein